MTDIDTRLFFPFALGEAEANLLTVPLFVLLVHVLNECFKVNHLLLGH